MRAADAILFGLAGFVVIGIFITAVLVDICDAVRDLRAAVKKSAAGRKEAQEAKEPKP